jgi:hypothetical protein
VANEPYQFGSEEDLRNVIRLLLLAYKRQQVRAETLDKVLSAVMALPPKERAGLSENHIISLIENVRVQAGAASDLYSEQIEKRLKNGDFLNALRIYASQQLRLTKPYKEDDS